jgi:hypothetical protein
MRILIIAGIMLLAQAVYAVEDVKKKSPRLKYKNGPVCMCTDGLSEKDISLKRQLKQVIDNKSTDKNLQQNDTSRYRDTEDE